MTKIFLYKGDNNTVISKGVDFSPNIIYMDPPYNTWNSNMIYSDKKDKSDWKNEFDLLVKNINSISQKDSVFFVSIGMAELANVILTFEKILGKNSIVAVMPRRTHSGHKTTKTITLQHDFVVVAKKGNVEFHGVEYNMSAYKNTDKHLKLRGKYQTRRVDYNNFSWSESMDCEINLEGKKFYPGGVDKTKWLDRKQNHNVKDWAWIWSENLIKFAYENDFLEISNGKLFKKTYSKAKIIKEDGEYKIKYFKRQQKISSLMFVEKKYAQKKDKTEPETLFDYPKTDELLRDLISLPNFDEKIVLDPFAGTGTTAIVSHELRVNEVHTIQIEQKTNEEDPAFKAGYKTIYKLTKANIEEKTKMEIIEK